MRYVLICPDDFLHHLLGGTTPEGDPPLYLVADAGVRARIARGGGQALSGNLDEPAIYRRAFRTGREAVLVAAPGERLTKILAALRAVVPQTPVLVLRDEEEPAGLPAGDCGSDAKSASIAAVSTPKVVRRTSRGSIPSSQRTTTSMLRSACASGVVREGAKIEGASLFRAAARREASDLGSESAGAAAGGGGSKARTSVTTVKPSSSSSETPIAGTTPDASASSIPLSRSSASSDASRRRRLSPSERRPSIAFPERTV